MAFIDQDEDIGVLVHIARRLCIAVSNLLMIVVTSGVLLRDQLDQVRAAGRPHGLHFAGFECALDLLVEIVTVGDDDECADS